MIVRWGQAQLPDVLRLVGSERPFLLAGERWDSPLDELGIEHVRWHGDLPTDELEAVIAWGGDFDGVVALGGGSTIDTGKAVSAAAGRPLVSIPTTYAGAEWTPYFGIRDARRRMHGGGAGAQLAGIVYEPRLTLSLPRAETVGTAMNALAHAAEALYAGRHDDAFAGAAAIGRWLPVVVEDGNALEARTRLLEGALRAGTALAERGLFLAHALAQALGGRYGLPHGAMNALCLAPALRFNEPAVPDAVTLLGAALERDDAIARVVELERLGGFGRLRDFGVPADDLGRVAEEAVARPGARANPRPVTAADAAELLRSIW